MSSMTLDFDQIRDQLPQAYPLILLDRVLELVPGERILALKNISGNEWMVPGHFPGKAVFPGVLLLESIAQAAILLLKATRPETAGLFLLVGVRSRFLRVVVPGDQVLFSCRLEKLASIGGIVEAEVTVGGERAATAALTFAVQSDSPAPEEP